MGYAGRMGFSSPKAIKPASAPPPVTQENREVTRAEEDARKQQLKRQGYEWTMNPEPSAKSLLATSAQAGMPQAAKPKKTLLAA